MRRTFAVTAVVVGALVLGGGAAASTLLPAHEPPPPAALTATGDGPTVIELAWQPPGRSTAGPVTAYSLTLVPTAGQTSTFTRWLEADETSARLDGAVAETSYRYELTAWAGDVEGRSASVDFTTPESTSRVVAVVDDEIVSIPSGGGELTRVAAAPAAPGGYVVDASGNVTVLDSERGTLVRRASSGAAPETLADDVEGARELAVDSLGTVYLLTADGRVAAYGARGAERTVARTLPAPGAQLSVGPDDSLLVLYGVADTNDYTARTYAPDGLDDFTERTFLQGVGLRDVVAGPSGTLFYDRNAGGASGLQFWGRDDGMPTARSVAVSSRATAVAGGLGSDGLFHVLEAAQTCPPALADADATAATCTEDLAVDALTATTTDGDRTTRAVTGVSLADAVDTGSLAADSSGTVLVAEPDGATPGLWAIDPDGTEARLLVPGSARDVRVVG